MIAALGWLAMAFGVAFGSALLPLINIELFVIGMAAGQAGMHWALIAAVVSVGQVAGKMLYFLAARGSIHLPAFLHRKPKPMTPTRLRWQLRTKRLRGWVEGIKERCERHPHWMVGTYGVSSVVGLPPYMAMTVLAGLVRMPLHTFVSVGLVGRFVRFSMLAASPAMFAGWFL